MNRARVLIVEDERIIALNLKCMMEKLGYEVLATVPSGERAVEVALELQPELVLMDIHLAGRMDGIEAATLMHRALAVPVIFLTAYAEDEILRRAQAVPPMGYLIKPFDMPELHATMQMALSRRAAERVSEDRRRQLELALEAGRFGLLEWDAASDRIQLSGCLPEVFNVASGILRESRCDFTARLDAEDQPAFSAALSAGAADAPGQTLEFHLAAGGERRLIEAHLRWSAGDSGQPRLTALIGDLTERRRSEQRLAQLAHFDALTGLPNRSLFADRLQQAVGGAQRSGTSFAILFLDLDGFKQINDTLGHDFGDLLLQSRAQGMSAALRRGDSLFRIGGDEFVVIVQDPDQAQCAELVARKLIDSVSRPVEIRGEFVSVSASVGIALFPQDGADRHQLLKAADAAMYRAKAARRGSYAYFTPELSDGGTGRARHAAEPVRRRARR